MNIKGLTNDELLRHGGLDDSMNAIEARLEIARRVLAGEWPTDEIQELESQIADLESEKADMLAAVHRLRAEAGET